MFIENEIYKMILENSIIEAVDLIIINEKWQILLWHRNNEPLKWIFYIPWWRRYKNEKIIDSIKRKANEELWIHIDDNKIFFLWIYDDIYSNSMFGNTPSHYSSITYVYKISKEEQKNIKKDKQHGELKFFNIDDPDINDTIKSRIQDSKDKKLI